MSGEKPLPQMFWETLWRITDERNACEAAEKRRLIIQAAKKWNCTEEDLIQRGILEDTARKKKPAGSLKGARP